MCRYIKYISCYAVITIILVGVVFGGLLYRSEYTPVFCFPVGGDVIQMPAYKDSNSTFYLFLPSHITLADVKILLPRGHTVLVGETKMRNNMTCASFDWDSKYTLIIDGRESSICFLQSQNIPSLYINTETGTMERIHQNKEYRESAEILLISKDGKTEHIDKTANIKGRGNATWRYDKKPYVLTLSEETSLLGMGKSSKWILLANALDYSHLRNKLAMDMARRVDFGWSPACEYVDVYLNGNYNGLYLLSEKIQVGPEHLDLNVSKGDFLCTVDFENRWDTMMSPFHTNSGRAIEICAPDNPSEDNELKIQNAVNELESIIFSSDNLKDNMTFDLDSWVCRYLMDEIFCNLDADVTSSYFYCKNGVVCAGPIWDYDMTLGNTFAIDNPEALYANLKIKYSGNVTSYYCSLYANDSFYDRMKEIYESRFLPVINEFNSSYIDKLSSHIADSVRMNNIRWKELFENVYELKVITPPSEDNSPKTFLSKRTDFFNRLCINNEEFFSVQFCTESWDDWQTFSVKKGESLENVPHIENGSWVIKGSEELFDTASPINENLIIESKPIIEIGASQPSSSSFALSRQELITVFTVFLVAILFLIFSIIEIYKLRRKGRADES